MAINLLGGGSPQKKKKEDASASFTYHIPEEEEKKLKEEKKDGAPTEPQKEQAPPIEEEVNFVPVLKKNIHRRQFLYFVIFGILVIAVGMAAYVLIPLQDTLFQQFTDVSDSVDTMEEPQEAQPATPEMPAELSPVPVLPDTPLAPLRGALVRFPRGQTVYLVEDNGELRPLILGTIIFENGLRIDQIDLSQIYVISDEWEGVRRGTEEVRGQVDFDPRVLSETELAPFQ